MGAPRGPRTGTPKIALGIRLPPSTIAWLDSEATRRGMTRATVAALCIERVHTTMDPKPSGG